MYILKKIAEKTFLLMQHKIRMRLQFKKNYNFKKKWYEFL